MEPAGEYFGTALPRHRLDCGTNQKNLENLRNNLGKASENLGTWVVLPLLMTWVVEVGDTPPLLMAPAAPDIAAFQLKVCTGIP